MDNNKRTKVEFKILEHNFPKSNNCKEISQWPVIYMLSNKKDIYIGETNDIEQRKISHSRSKKNYNFNKMIIVFSRQFNKSAVYNIETKLINYIFAEGKYNVTNKDFSQRVLNYYEKDTYDIECFNDIWNKLLELKIVNTPMEKIEDKALFKYSPFTRLSSEQYEIIAKILENMLIETGKFSVPFAEEINKIYDLKDEKVIELINGAPGTGKTLLAMKLLCEINEKVDMKKRNIGLCLPQTAMRKEIRSILKVMNLENVEIISPEKINLKKWDFLIIDEAHRLKQYTGVFARYPHHLVIDKEKNIFTNELELAIKNSNKLVLLYDENQKVRDTDIENFKKSINYHYNEHMLTSQFRVNAGVDYLNCIQETLQINETNSITNLELGDYEIKFCDSLKELHKSIVEKNDRYTRCRIGSGYYVKWDKETQKKIREGNYYDFQQEGYNINWNSCVENWFNSKNAINEIGCIHTLQGYDLNFAGVIFGDEIIYNKKTKRIEIIPENYKDTKSFPKKNDPLFYEKLDKTIKNIYYVLMTRGIKGTYLYVKNKDLRNYLEDKLGK